MAERCNILKCFEAFCETLASYWLGSGALKSKVCRWNVCWHIFEIAEGNGSKNRSAANPADPIQFRGLLINNDIPHSSRSNQK